MKHFCALLMCFGLVCSSAHAGWFQKFSAGGDDKAAGTSIQSPDGQHVFACGFNMAVSNPFTDPIHKILTSNDAGEHWTDITSQVQGIEGFMLMPMAIYFPTDELGFLAIGKNIYRSLDGGLNWSATAMSDDVGALWFVDEHTGLAAGAKGNIWRTTDSGLSWKSVQSTVSEEVRKFYFLDSQHGWAVAYDSDESEEQAVALGGAVLKTSDGGLSWETIYETNGDFLNCVFFSDESHGWVCAAGSDGEVFFWQTSDGNSFSRQSIPQTADGLFGGTKSLAGMHVSGQSGMAVGLFDTGMSSSDGGKIYMLADYSSDDGGQSWTLHVNDPGQFPDIKPEGGVLAAFFYSDDLAWAIGTGLRIFKNAPPCKNDGDCFNGFLCVDGSCEANTDGPCSTDDDCFGDSVCRDGTCGEAPPGPCESDDDCPEGKQCNHGHCTDPSSCVEGSSTGCPFGQICIFGGCIQDKTCQSDDDCTNTQRCWGGRCYPDDLPEFRCIEDADCAESEKCVDTWCERKDEPDGGSPDGLEDGSTEDDGGVDLDSGPESDTGGSHTGDGTPETDNQDGTGEGGCACGSGPGGSWSVVLLLLFFWLGWIRRRGSFDT